MHSAVELVYVIKNYLITDEKDEIKKENLLTDAVCKDASKYIAGIITAATSKRK